MSQRELLALDVRQLRYFTAVVDHRTSILPLVLDGVGDAVLPSGWTELAHLAGAVTYRIDPTSHLRIAAITRQHRLSPPASAFMHTAARSRRTPDGDRTC